MNSDWWIAAPILGLVVVVVAFAFYIVHGPTPYRRERELSAVLATEGVAATGRIVNMERATGGDAYASVITLDVAVAQAGGGEHKARLQVLVDRELMVEFMPGKTVYLRYDAADPKRIAIDRNASPTQIPAPWRK
jgi:hypothetical protein